MKKPAPSGKSEVTPETSELSRALGKKVGGQIARFQGNRSILEQERAGKKVTIRGFKEKRH